MNIHQSPKAGSVPYKISFELECYKLLDADTEVTTYMIKPDSIEAIYFKPDGKLVAFTPALLIHYKDGTYAPLSHMNDTGEPAIDCLKCAKESMRYVDVP